MRSTIIDYFISLVQIDSESKNEMEIALSLEADLQDLGAVVHFDKANEKTEGNVGNLYAYFPGKVEKEPILFCAHLDTVVPGNGVKPKIREDRIISDGTTVLGSDDKSGIAEIVWAIKELKENNERLAPIEVLFTISEEIGLLGAKYLDYSMIKSKIGYALDAHEIGEITIAAPSQNSMKYTVIGKEAHAGAEPEKGINAIKIAAEAISKMPMGRIDDETTCNVGVIKGGRATNIVPNKVKIKAEARSHNNEKLRILTKQMSETIKQTAEKYKLDDFQADVKIKVVEEYQAFKLDEEDHIVELVKKASENCGLNFKTSISGGGSDVNIFNRNGLKMGVLGTGMNKVHTVDEFILIKDLEDGARWIKEIIREYSK
ncbi:MAG TPA: M20/M25/M40 family metallo-hydrolase [Candidatus Cloacimonetes bacterium]|nr:M20/M25/M40 family metallo-hydrolase [Candidatus Cloacimonadota bacterium]